MKINKTKIVSILGVVLLGPAIAMAWTSAPANPPSGNVAEPLNVGTSLQNKSGTIKVNTGVVGDGSDAASVGLVVKYGGMGIGTGNTVPGFKLQVGLAGDGSAIGTNAFFYMSDASLKKDVSTLSNSLEKILKLRGVSFTWKGSNEKSVGLIAQEVEKVYPELVTGEEGHKAVQYGNLVAPLIEAVKAQQAEIEVLKARISVLEAK